MSLCLTRHREVAHALQIANDAGHVVYVVRVAVRAPVEVTLVYMSAVIADSVGNVVRKVVASLLCCHAEQVTVLSLRQVLREVHVQCRATSEVFNIWRSVEFELIYDVEAVVFYHVEV